MIKANDEINEHLIEIIRDKWGITARNLVQFSGLPQRLVMHHLKCLEQSKRVFMDEGKYVACR